MYVDAPSTYETEANLLPLSLNGVPSCNVLPSVPIDIGPRVLRGNSEVYGSHFFIPD
jgi:hypothetical protein